MDIAGTDFNGIPILSDLTMDFGGSVGSFTVNGASGYQFIGWAGTEVLSDAVVGSVDPGTTLNWVASDNVYTGQAVPEPATLLALGAGLAILLARRRK
jgi:hypothetical protein